jgi:hypothetical protein
VVSRERAANEHGFADLKNWRILANVGPDGPTVLRVETLTDVTVMGQAKVNIQPIAVAQAPGSGSWRYLHLPVYPGEHNIRDGLRRRGCAS